MELFILVAVMCSALGYVVAGETQKPVGAILGLLLGPLGVVAAAILRK